MAELLLVEVLPAGRVAALGPAQSLPDRVGGERSPASVRSRVFTTAWPVAVESDAVGILVRRVETPLLVPDWQRSQAER